MYDEMGLLGANKAADPGLGTELHLVRLGWLHMRPAGQQPPLHPGPLQMNRQPAHSAALHRRGGHR